MLKHYLEKTSELEFSERNREIPRLVTQGKNDMNARGVLHSTITLEKMADFFSAEFLARCDFLKDFIVSYSSLLDRESDSDVVTEAKTLFQNVSFTEKNKIEVLYNSSTESIAESLLNESMKNEIKGRFFLQWTTE